MAEPHRPRGKKRVTSDITSLLFDNDITLAQVNPQRELSRRQTKRWKPKHSVAPDRPYLPTDQIIFNPSFVPPVSSEIYTPIENIYGIIQHCTSFPQCPICLETPVLPFSPTCGHSMCLPCLKRLADEEYKTRGLRAPRKLTCPICHQASVQPSALRPVFFHMRAEFKRPRGYTWTRFQRVACSSLSPFPAPVEERVDEWDGARAVQSLRFCPTYVPPPELLASLDARLRMSAEDARARARRDFGSDEEAVRAVLAAEALLPCRPDEYAAEAVAQLETQMWRGIPDRPRFFYQRDDGAPLFLNSSCATYLMRSASPPVSLRVPVAHVDVVRAADLPFSFLSFLPAQTPVGLADVDLLRAQPRLLDEAERKDFAAKFRRREQQRGRQRRSAEAQSKRMKQKLALMEQKAFEKTKRERPLPPHISRDLPVLGDPQSPQRQRQAAERFRMARTKKERPTVKERNSKKFVFSTSWK